MLQWRSPAYRAIANSKSREMVFSSRFYSVLLLIVAVFSCAIITLFAPLLANFQHHHPQCLQKPILPSVRNINTRMGIIREGGPILLPSLKGGASSTTTTVPTSTGVEAARSDMSTFFDGLFNSGGLGSTPTNNRIGKLDVSPMGIGTWAWGNQLIWGYDVSMDTELQEVFNLCVSKGVNLFDTGDSYGTGSLEGQSEKLLGRFISELPDKRRSDIKVATKLASYPWRVTSGQFVSAAEASKRRLQGSLAIGQLHWPVSNYAPWQERALWDGLVEMYEKEVVKEVGVSNYGPKSMKRIQRYLSSRGTPLASNQVQYSLLSRRNDCKEANDECGVSTIAYSPLCLGLLTGRYNESYLPKSAVRRQLFKQLLPKAKPLLQELEAVAASRRKTMSQVSINWCMAKGCIPIPGAKNKAQAIENLGALGWKLTPGEVDALDLAAEKANVETVQNIFMTS